MSDIISCICGYRGAAVVEDGRTVCPLCQGRVKSIEIDPLPDDGRPKRRRFRLPGEDAEEEAPAEAEAPWPAAEEQEADAAALPLDDDSVQPAGPVVYRIPCPKGHVLDVREDLLGQQVVCPDCNTFFVLRATDSLEYRKEQTRRRQLAEERRAESWLKIAIWAAVIIGFSFIVMIVIALNPGLWRRD
jgi:uncharacterized Zn finger protein (UPF0148 family)